MTSFTGGFFPQLWITMWTTRPVLGHGDSLTHDAGSSHPAGGQVHVTSDRDSFSEVWQQVVAELNSDSAIGHDPLTRQQKAWLSLVQPLTLVEGFALLAVPTPLVQ